MCVGGGIAVVVFFKRFGVRVFLLLVVCIPAYRTASDSECYFSFVYLQLSHRIYYCNRRGRDPPPFLFLCFVCFVCFCFFSRLIYSGVTPLLF